MIQSPKRYEFKKVSEAFQFKDTKNNNENSYYNVNSFDDKGKD